MKQNEELTADDKRHLDRKIRDFLESDERICWDYNPKKVQYCFESFKQAFELGKDPKCYFKKLEYYKDLVVQRDKEICILILINFLFIPFSISLQLLDSSNSFADRQVERQRTIHVGYQWQ